jgi:hypothetical protein
MKYADDKMVLVYCLVGNHSLCNEKGKEHALEFLRPYCIVVSYPCSINGFNFIPYQTDPAEFLHHLADFRIGETVIIHQGVKGGNAGHYIQDHSAVEASDLKNYVTVGGHYHNHHTIQGHTFIGNPYTLTYGEANDPPKGFCVLYDDGSLEHVPTNLRKHVAVDLMVDAQGIPCWGHTLLEIGPHDLVWVKAKGSTFDLQKLDKQQLGGFLGVKSFKLDLIPTDAPTPRIPNADKMTPGEVMDALIDASQEDPFRKTDLKGLWRKVIS